MGKGASEALGTVCAKVEQHETEVFLEYMVLGGRRWRGYGSRGYR